MKYIKCYKEVTKGMGNIVDIETSIKYLKKIPKELKEEALKLVTSSTKAKNGKITELKLHPDLKKKIADGGYPDGFSMGIDKDGYFIHTHRVRSKSHEKPDGITVKEIKFIETTG